MKTTTEETKKETIPEFEGKAAACLKEYYEAAGVRDLADAEQKIAALESNIGKFAFSAYGGGETTQMRLRAAERVYLLKQRIAVE